MSATHTIPQGTLAHALTEAGVVSSNFIYFDLMHHLDEQLMPGELKARVFASMAWSLDMRCISLARAVFFRTYREAVESGTVDAFNEFANAMNEQAAAGKLTPAGFVQNDEYTVLTQLLSLRGSWHDHAMQHATRSYEPKQLTELVLGERVRTVGIDSKAKIALRAKFAAGDDEKLQERLMNDLITKSNATLAQQHELRQKLNPAVLRILQFAGARASDSEPEFHELPIESQRWFVEGTLGAIDRALADLINARSVTLDDYAIALRDGMALQKSIKLVLDAPKFKRSEL